MDKDRLMKIQEVAEYLNLSPKTIASMVYQKRIPHIKLSRRCLRFKKSDIDRWIAEKQVDHPISACPVKKSKPTIDRDMIDRLVRRVKEEVFSQHPSAMLKYIKKT